MGDARVPFPWPGGSWRVLKKIVRAWYTAENRGGELTQRTVAKLAAVQASRVSVNKSFLQAIGIVQPEGIALTEAGKRLGLGLAHENARITQQALQRIVLDNPVLRPLLDIVRSRGAIDKEGFKAEVLLLTKQGEDTPGFNIGVGVLEDILLESGFVGLSDNTFRSVRPEFSEQANIPSTNEEPDDRRGGRGGSNKSDLRKIPIPITASTVWYIEIGETPEPGDIDKFIEMQKLLFGHQAK